MTEGGLQRIAEHVYWMPPGPPDRPSLCAVVGSEYTLMLDAGASDAHARLFLDALHVEGVRPPRYVALTHWHWDHIFGAAELNIPVIAHQMTAKEMAVQAGYGWTDAALDARVADGKEIAFCADNIKLELPEPRRVRILLPEIVFSDSLDIHLGDVTCHLQHVGGDHAADSCVIFVEPDEVLFLGDSLYDAIYAPTRYLTRKNLCPLLDNLLGFDATCAVEGHTPTVYSREAFKALAEKMKQIGTVVRQYGEDEAAVLAAMHRQTGAAPDEDTVSLVQAFIAGRAME
jgi:glyoxylase-like metal-dependent hydrolase (beta-lactamase superfamily II)